MTFTEILPRRDNKVCRIFSLREIKISALRLVLNVICRGVSQPPFAIMVE